MVELLRAGREPEDLSREFEPRGQSIRNWVAQAERQEGRHGPVKANALGAAERDELARLSPQTVHRSVGSPFLRTEQRHPVRGWVPPVTRRTRRQPDRGSDPLRRPHHRRPGHRATPTRRGTGRSSLR